LKQPQVDITGIQVADSLRALVTALEQTAASSANRPEYGELLPLEDAASGLCSRLQKTRSEAERLDTLLNDISKAGSLLGSLRKPAPRPSDLGTGDVNANRLQARRERPLVDRLDSLIDELFFSHDFGPNLDGDDQFLDPAERVLAPSIIQVRLEQLARKLEADAALPGRNRLFEAHEDTLRDRAKALRTLADDIDPARKADLNRVWETWAQRTPWPRFPNSSACWDAVASWELPGLGTPLGLKLTRRLHRLADLQDSARPYHVTYMRGLDGSTADGPAAAAWQLDGRERRSH
jgi:hypothetical protein